MVKYFISHRTYNGPQSFKWGWTDWSDYTRTLWTHPEWIFNNKKLAEKELKKLKKEALEWWDYKIIEYEQKLESN